MRIYTRLIPMILCIVAAPALAQLPADQNAPLEPEGKKDLRYQVFEITGKVRVAYFGADPESGDGWRPVVKGELLEAGQQISTSLRSKLKLVAYPSTPPTVILIEQLSLVGINDLQFKDGAARARIGLGYGAIRAGVAEGEVRSDMEISCPVATLSKKGTDIFRFEYRNNRWSMALSPLGRGQIQAIQHRYSGIVGGRRWTGGPMMTRNVFAGQLVTHAMARTIDTTVFNRNINVRDIFGLEDIEIKFQNVLGNGLGFKLLGQNLIGNQIGGVQGQQSTNQQGTQSQQMQTMNTGNSSLQLQNAIDRLRGQGGVRPHSGGDFGIGQIPLLNIFGGGQNTTQRSIRNSMLDCSQLKNQMNQNITGCKRK